MFVLISGYFEGVDIFNYRYDYAQLAAGFRGMFEIDFGYYLLEVFCASKGMDFFTFKKILTFFGLVLFFIGVKKLSFNPCYVFAVYLSYQIVMDTIQFRNFMGFCVFMFALPFLLKDNRKSHIIYAVLIIIAGSFHVVMYWYLIFLLKNNKYVYRIAVAICILFISMTLMNNMKVPFIDIVVRYLYSLKNIVSYTGGTSAGGSSYAFFLPTVTLIYYILVFRYFSRKAENSEYRNVLKIDAISLFAVPFCFMAFQWYRIIRNINIYNYCMISNLKRDARKSPIRKYIVVCSFLVLSIWMYAEFFRFVGWESVMTVFENNIFVVKDYL